jgi:hypothetical protein
MNIHYWIACAMQGRGGSFVQKLGACYLAADDGNRQKLQLAFPAYFAQYAEIAKVLKAEDDAKDFI